MTIVRIKGLKRYRSKGRWFCYHRSSGKRVHAEFGTPAFFEELAALERRSIKPGAKPGTMGALLKSYQSSPAFQNLAPSTRAGYRKIISLLANVDEMPLIEFTAPFVAELRDLMSQERGRRTANFVMSILSVAAEHGRERGFLSENPVKGVKRARRDSRAPVANRAWTRDECRAALEHLPSHLALPVALAMFTGLRQGDVLTLTTSAIRDDRIWRRTGKTGQEISLPLHDNLKRFLGAARPNDVGTIATNAFGQAWTSDGFRSSFGKAMKELEAAGKIGPGLTFHGLRHTVGSLLREITDDLDLIRRWLGQSTLSMAQHYSRSADVSEKMSRVAKQFDPLGTKVRVSAPGR